MIKIKVALLFLVSIILSLSFGLGFLSSFEHNTYDMLLSKSGVDSGQVVIVAIDDYSIEQIGRYPWDRDIYATLLDKLVSGGVSAVGFDMIFSEVQGEQDLVFSEALSLSDVAVLAINADFSGEVTKEDKELIANSFYIPNEYLMEANPSLGFINNLVDSDNVMRRVVTSVYDSEYEVDRASFNYEIYKKYAQKNGLEITDLDTSYFSRPYISFIGGDKSIETISFFSVINDEIPVEYFENKIVLVGIEASGGEDVYYTPAGPMYGVEIHANFINNLIENKIVNNIFPDNLYYYNDTDYVDMSKAVFVLISGIVYLIIAIKLRDRASIKLIATIALIVLYFIIQFTLIKYNYIINIIYPIVLTIILFIVDMGMEYYIARKERHKITNIFSKYMSKEIVEKIVNDGEDTIKLGGDKKHIAVMFIDIRGFTPLSESLPPEETFEILNEYLSMATSQIFRFNGVLDKYIGDGIMVLFNVPYDVEEPEFTCIKTAIEIRKNGEILRDRLMEKYGKIVEFGIGINCGFAIVGNVGSEARMDYTAIGDTVNTAARLESKAMRGQILISEDVYKKVEDKVKVNLVGELQLKGKENHILTYEVIDILHKGE